MIDITAVGEILIDLTQSGVNELGIPVFAANPGGAPANLAVAAARLGASTAFIGKVGTGQSGTGYCFGDAGFCAADDHALHCLVAPGCAV